MIPKTTVTDLNKIIKINKTLKRQTHTDSLKTENEIWILNISKIK
jgi:hypothetical protein